MSSELITVNEASRILGVSVRTIRRYVSTGLLQYKGNRGSAKLLSATDVGDLRRTKDTNPVIRRRETIELRAKLQRLEAQMETVLRILDAKDTPIGVSPEYGKTLLQYCLDQLKRGAWTEDEVKPWLEVFLRIDETDFMTIAVSSKEPKPWKPFLLLNMEMARHVSTHEDYQTSLTLQSSHKLLCEGRRRLRMSALIFQDLYSVSDPLLEEARRALPGSVADAVEEIVRLSQ